MESDGEMEKESVIILDRYKEAGKPMRTREQSLCPCRPSLQNPQARGNPDGLASCRGVSES
jgi:hypothetical protein